jgi:hypothetical protein
MWVKAAGDGANGACEEAEGTPAPTVEETRSKIASVGREVTQPESPSPAHGSSKSCRRRNPFGRGTKAEHMYVP